MLGKLLPKDLGMGVGEAGSLTDCTVPVQVCPVGVEGLPPAGMEDLPQVGS